MARPRTPPAAAAPAAAVAVLALAGCSGQSLPESTGAAGTVVVDGVSSTIPLAEAARDEFVEVEPGVVVEVSTSSAGRALEKLCAGESDVALVTRPMTEEESAVCDAAGVTWAEMPVAVDAVSVVASAENDFLRCLTREEVAQLWAPAAEGTLTTWSQLREDFPELPVRLFGPTEGSGTLDYLTAEDDDTAGASRADYAASDDDNVIIDGVRENPGGLGLVGLPNAAQAEGVRRVAIDSGQGCVSPGPGAATDGSYALSRTLLAYPSTERYEADPAVSAFVDYLVDRSAVLARRSGAVPLGEGQESVAREALTSLGDAG